MTNGPLTASWEAERPAGGMRVACVPPHGCHSALCRCAGRDQSARARRPSRAHLVCHRHEQLRPQRVNDSHVALRSDLQFLDLC
jgi:hypothetical protein